MSTVEPNDPKPQNNNLLSPESFNIHRQLVFFLFFVTLIITIITSIMLGIVYFQGDNQSLTILPMVADAGMFGAFVSALRRLYSFQDIFPSERYQVLMKGTNWYIIAYSSIPPLIGLIASTILYIVFASGMLSGDLFPKFKCKGEDCSDFVEFLRNWKPEQATDYAKAIVWGFIAGFSERFVPDILNRLAEKD